MNLERTKNGISSIEKLSDVCLLRIFEHLPIADRFRIERVSKKWQRISQISWRSFKTLNFHPKTWGLSEKKYNALIKSIGTQSFRKIVIKFGRYLTSVSMSMFTFSTICSLCPNVKELNLINILSGDGLEVCVLWLKLHKDNIERLNFQLYYDDFKKRTIKKLLSAMKRMRRLKSVHVSYLTTKHLRTVFLLSVPFDRIQEISLEGPAELESKLPLALRATQIIRRYKKLKKIHFSEMCIPNFNSLFEALPACADTLNSLRLSSLDGKVENSSRLLTNLSKLIFLEKLDVRFSSEFVDDSFLEVVAKHCKLITSLMIGGCGKVTDNGISSIGDGLQKLRLFSITNSSNLKCPPLEKIRTLEELNCSYCFKLEEECLSKILQTATSLRVLKLRGCYLITNNVLNSAINALKNRNPRIPLNLYISFTNIKIHLMQEKPKFLHIFKSSTDW